MLRRSQRLHQIREPRSSLEEVARKVGAQREQIMNGRSHLGVLITLGKLQTSPRDIQSADNFPTQGIHQRYTEQSAKQGRCIAKPLAQFANSLKSAQALYGGRSVENIYGPSLQQPHSELFAPPLPSIRKPFDQFQSRFNTSQRLRICAPIHRLFARESEVLDRFCRVVARTIVMGEISVMILEPLQVQGFDRLASALMEESAALTEQRVVCDVTGERMFEDVFDIAGRGLLIDELTQLQQRESLLQFLVWKFAQLADDGQSELGPDHGKRLE